MNVTIFQMAIDDDVIEQLRINDSDDEDLKAALDAYFTTDIPEGTEIYQSGNDYLVCELGVFIASYDDDVKQIPE